MVKAVEYDLTTRIGLDKSAEHFRYMDDKWLFTRDYPEKISTKAGFKDVSVFPLGTRCFKEQTEVNLRLFGGSDTSSLPDFAWKILESYDASFSMEWKKELFFEGSIIFRT